METEQGAYERRAYEVHGRQLGWRVSQLQQQGYPYTVQPAAGGVYIVVVQQPPAVNPFAYAEYSRPRQAWPALDSANVLRWVLVVGVAAMLLGAAYMVFSQSGQADQPQPAQAEDGGGSVWGWFDNLRFPWEPDAPAAQATQAPQDDGWKWPWESAGDSLAAAAESVQGTVTAVSASILAVLVLLIILALVRRRR